MRRITLTLVLVATLFAITGAAWTSYERYVATPRAFEKRTAQLAQQVAVLPAGSVALQPGEAALVPGPPRKDVTLGHPAVSSPQDLSPYTGAPPHEVPFTATSGYVGNFSTVHYETKVQLTPASRITVVKDAVVFYCPARTGAVNRQLGITAKGNCTYYAVRGLTPAEALPLILPGRMLCGGWCGTDQGVWDQARMYISETADSIGHRLRYPFESEL